MRRGGVRRAFRAPWSVLARGCSVLVVVVLAATAGGCASNLQSIGRLTAGVTPVSSGATVAFESIDGPPPAVFRKLVDSLNNEAEARQIAVVSRSGPATYRVRGYVSALVADGKPSFAWVWDVYDADKRRALRISGEEPAAGRSRDAWAAADDQVLRGMARSGMERIAAFLGAPERAPAERPVTNLLTLAAARDDTPEAAGIFRLWGGGRPPESIATADPAADDAPRQTAARTPRR
jgi:hypothetical protein